MNAAGYVALVIVCFVVIWIGMAFSLGIVLFNLVFMPSTLCVKYPILL